MLTTPAVYSGFFILPSILRDIIPDFTISGSSSTVHISFGLNG